MVLVPLAMLWLAAWGLHYWSRKAKGPSTILATRDDDLYVRRTTFFGVREWDWKSSELAGIRVEFDDPDSSSPSLVLKIFPHDGPVIGLLNGVKDQELYWVAAVLRHNLGVPEQPHSPPDTRARC